MKTIFSRLIVLIAVCLAVPSAAQDISKKRGRVTTYYNNGKKESSGKVKNYRRKGTWKYWDTEGYLLKTVQFTNGEMNGTYTRWFQDGSVCEQGMYMNGKKNGAWNSFYQGGKKAEMLNYVSGDYDGLQQWWYENGQLREKTMYDDGKIVNRQTWYYNGRPKAVETYTNGLAEGTWRSYPDPSEANDSFPASVDHYVQGKRNGLHIGYSHGIRTEEISYKDDKLDGPYKKWDYTGSLGIFENYKNDERDGLCKYFDKGKLIREVEYSNGRRNGTEKEYYFGSSLTRMSWFRNGTLDSVYTYFPNGKTETTRVYRYYPGFIHTEEFSVYTEYDSTGFVLLQGEYHFQDKDKEWKTYYPGGRVKSVTPYSNGKISGVYRKWYDNGKLMIEMQCDGNNVTAPPKAWYRNGQPVKANAKYYEELVESSKPGEVYNDPSQYHVNRTAFPSSENEVTTLTGGPEEDAQFPGGQPALMKFLQQEIRYPRMDKENGNQGTVYVSFMVGKDGSVSDVKVVKGIPGAPGLEKEAVRVVSIMPNWIPARLKGEPVPEIMHLPVKFMLR